MNKIYAILAFLVLGASATMAQQPMKFGHINTAELISVMPDFKAVDDKLDAEFSEKETQLTGMQEELQRLQKEYQQTASTLTPTQRGEKEQQLQEMGQKVQNFYMLAQQQMQAREQELRTPIVQKVKTAIAEVGDEGGFLYIFDLSSNVPVFNSDKSIDVTPLVKAKLGMQ